MLLCYVTTEMFIYFNCVCSVSSAVSPLKSRAIACFNAGCEAVLKEPAMLI
jgi:hypothetical protein